MFSRVILLAAPALLLAACEPKENADAPDRRQTYSLCPRNSEARPQLEALVRQFAGKHEASLIDRGTEAQDELAGMRKSKGALENTGGDLAILTVDRPGHFRVSLSNLGLREKFALSVRYWREDEAPVAAFLKDVERLWIVQPVEGGVTDDPPCAPVD